MRSCPRFSSLGPIQGKDRGNCETSGGGTERPEQRARALGARCVLVERERRRLRDYGELLARYEVPGELDEHGIGVGLKVASGIRQPRFTLVHRMSRARPWVAATLGGGPAELLEADTLVERAAVLDRFDHTFAIVTEPV